MLHDIPDDWQHKDIEQAARFARGNALALDVGAHRGVVTTALLRDFKRVVAIEPSDLAEQIQGATVIRACVSNQAGKCGMAHGKHNTGQRHVAAGDDYDVITIDSLGLAPDFIKLDVEGMEYFALLGAADTIRKYEPVIMFEENGLNRRYGVADGECGRLLESWGAARVLVLRNGSDEDWVYQWPR